MKKYFPWIIVSVVGVLVFWIANLFLVTKFIDNWGDRGTFGDLFGAANALFSGLAFAGLIIAILLQREELILQREELKKSTEALNQQAKELKFTVEESKLQNQTLRIQQFENTFFQLLKKLDESSRVVRYKIGGNIEKNGDEAFSEFNTLLNQPEMEFKQVLRKFLGEGGYGGPYLRLFIHILKFIDSKDFIDDISKSHYINILRAYLTFEQIHFLRVWSENEPNFKKFTDKYNIFDHTF